LLVQPVENPSKSKWHMEFQVQEGSHDYEVFLRTNRGVLEPRIRGKYEMGFFLFSDYAHYESEYISKYINVHRFLAGSRL
jgi:hypothetical protein